MNDISWEKFNIGKDFLYYALINTTPADLYGNLDGILEIPQEYIKEAHKYYFGYNLTGMPPEKEFENLLSLLPGNEFPQVTDNKIAKEEYNRMRFNKFQETNPKLRKMLEAQQQISLKFNKHILLEETSNVLKSLNPAVDLSKLHTFPFDKLRDIQDLIREQIYYVKHIADCQKIFIMVYWRNMPIGGVVIFYNPNYQDKYIYIQGITKYPIIFLIDTLYPEESKHIPKLNTILDPIIQLIGKELGAKYIYVNPVGRQGEFLEKYYNYRLNTNVIPPKPCSDMLDPSDDIISYYKPI